MTTPSSAPTLHTTGPLVSATALAAWLQSAPSAEQPWLVDVSFDLADPGAGRRAYESAHLPGACYAHLNDDLSGPGTDEHGQWQGRHPLPSPRVFLERMQALGWTTGRPAVVMDRQGSMLAARLWWMFEALGQPVWVLDGGVPAWQALGLPTERATPSEPTPTTPTPTATATATATATGPTTPAPTATTPTTAVAKGVAAVDVNTWPGTVNIDAVAALLGRRRMVDARAPERFRGEVEPLDGAAGHVPGAINRFFKDNLDAQGRFKPAGQLQAEWAALLAGHPPHEVIYQCGSGVTACHNLLAVRVAGWPSGLLYPGSWSQWSADPKRPVAKGA